MKQYVIITKSNDARPGGKTACVIEIAERLQAVRADIMRHVGDLYGLIFEYYDHVNNNRIIDIDIWDCYYGRDRSGEPTIKMPRHHFGITFPVMPVAVRTGPACNSLQDRRARGR